MVIGATKAHVNPRALAQARTDLGVVASRGNTGGIQCGFKAADIRHMRLLATLNDEEF